MPPITPEILLQAYANGYFPMAETAHSKDLHWFYPEKRGILPLDAFHIPKSLTKFLNKAPFSYTTNRCFEQVMRSCAQRDKGTWINEEIIALYCELHRMGHAHSVEVWAETSKEHKTSAGARVSLEPSPMGFSVENPGDNQTLTGGLYGVSLGGAFFGESMFSRRPNASKAALVHLVNLLNTAGYTLLDAQYVNDHLKQFGIIEISRKEYLKRLESALKIVPSGIFDASAKTY